MADCSYRACSSCGGKRSCLWADDAWVCQGCGDEWYPDHGPEYAAPSGEGADHVPPLCQPVGQEPFCTVAGCRHSGRVELDGNGSLVCTCHAPNNDRPEQRSQGHIVIGDRAVPYDFPVLPTNDDDGPDNGSILPSEKS